MKVKKAVSGGGPRERRSGSGRKILVKSYGTGAWRGVFTVKCWEWEDSRLQFHSERRLRVTT